MDLSVIVNFYNMRREAARTLTALTRAYQRGIGELQYEVLCLDNGSNPPLDEAFIESFGPEFRLVRPEAPHPSPVGPMNAVARQAKGRFLAVMIDGAHVLTPGALRLAMESFAEHPDGVVALRPWFVGGDQRWLSVSGYTRELEDKLFEGIGWPKDGYDLFRIGVPMSSTQNAWFRGMAESNCLFLSAALHQRIGGFDEGFDEPGAGLANLDIFARAIDAAEGPPIALLGEASFHQFHDGTTTNVSDDEKDRRVRDYMIKYQEVKGEGFRSADMSNLTFRGGFATGTALKLERRPSFPRGVRLTDDIRPISFDEHFEPGMRQYLISAYAEASLDRRTHWLGQPIDLYPADLVALQEIMTRTRPTHLVFAGAEPGLAVFADSILKLLEIPSPTFIWASEASGEPEGLRARVRPVIGEVNSPKTLKRIGHALGTAESTLVLFAVDGSPKLTAQNLADYAQFVAHRCYLVALRTARGQPWIGYARLRGARAISDLVRSDPGLVVDTSWERNVLSSCPSGFVLRVGEAAPAYDESLDHIPEPVS
ncbi:MAG TPA: CmcI family methyltransferase [Caulobacteraceae bacterium]